MSRIFVATTDPYLNNWIRPFKSDFVKIKYLFNIKPIKKVITDSMAKAAVGAVIRFGKKGIER